MDLLSCLLGSVQCLETTLRNKSVGETTFRSGLAISEEWNGLLSNLTRTPLWTSGQCQKPIRKMAHNKGAFGLSVFIRSLKRKYSHKFQDQMKTWDCIFA